jgi:hypothetical protein
LNKVLFVPGPPEFHDPLARIVVWAKHVVYMNQNAGLESWEDLEKEKANVTASL